ncbi:phosphoglycolate phosphatase [Gammaproteobacteria bacterium]
MAYRLIIFDWDGTLIDSEGHIVSCFQKAACDLGLPPLTYAAVRNIIGLGLMESCAVLLPSLDEAGQLKLVDRYRYHYFQESTHDSSHLFPEVEKTLWRLHDNGYLLAIATGKSRRGLNRALREMNLEHFFHATRCADETTSKPDPRMVLEILDELNFSPGQAVMIGDTEYDMEMAHNAAIACIAVTYGAHERERLLRWQPLACLDELSELCALLASFE